MQKALPVFIRTVDLEGLLASAFAALFRWQERSRQRHSLAGLDDRMLQDIGLSRLDVEHEIRKPFWQA